jgi:hypothetical protein
VLDLTWPQICLMLDGALYNAPTIGSTDGSDNGSTPAKPLDDADKLRIELQQASKLCPDLTPHRIEQLVEEFRRKKEAATDERQ